MLVDSHCHLDDPRFDTDRDTVWNRALEAGVHAAVIPGVEPATWDRTVACARTDARAGARAGTRYIALGIHPRCLPGLSDTDVSAALAGLGARCRDADAVAVGECGFDGTVDLARAGHLRQRAVFMAHVEVARALDLPLVVHVFRAHAQALVALREVRLPRTPGVIHSCSASVEVAREYVSLGFHLGFGGAITRPGARRPVETLRAVPLHRLLLETDAPDQVPTGVPPGVDGAVRRCEPGHLTVTLARAASLRGETLTHLAAVTTENARTLFRLR